MLRTCNKESNDKYNAITKVKKVNIIPDLEGLQTERGHSDLLKFVLVSFITLHYITHSNLYDSNLDNGDNFQEILEIHLVTNGDKPSVSKSNFPFLRLLSLLLLAVVTLPNFLDNIGNSLFT